jgi:hypothetical protein
MNEEEIMPDEAPDDDLLADEPAAIREELRRKLKTEGARVAYDTMVAVAQDPKAQASARATCAVALFRGAGFLGKRADEEDASEGKTPDQMTAAELEAEIRRLRASRLRNQRIIRRAAAQDEKDDKEGGDGGALD